MSTVNASGHCVASPERQRFNGIMEIVLDDYSGQRQTFYKLASEDERLIHVCTLAQQIGEQVMIAEYGVGPQRPAAEQALTLALMSIASFTVAWLVKNDPLQCLETAVTAVREEIFRERVRQRFLILARKLIFDCSSPIVDNRRKFRAPFEEAGEVAQAIDYLERRDIEQGRFDLRVELIQVAAVAIAWLEALIAEH
jgi:hypothetical protein